MATLDSLQFEMERRVILFKPTTTMPDSSQLGYNADPNLITSPSTPGEELLYYSPNNTRYVTYDASGNTIQEYYKKSQPNGWLPLGGGTSSSLGTDSSTWQLNLSNSGVILQSDGSSNLIIKDPDGSAGTLIVGSLKIDNLTGYLRAIDGSIIADSSAGNLLTYGGLLPGDDLTTEYNILHNLNSENHLLSVYTNINEIIYPDIIIGDVSDNITFIDPIPNTINYKVVIIGF